MKKHGYYQHPLYPTWSSMMAKCHNPNHKESKYYAGITVCEHWHSIENFISDMQPKPFAGAELSRIDKAKGYSPDNCRWSKPGDNKRNRVRKKEPEKFCKYCGIQMLRKDYNGRLEDMAVFMRRQYCGRECSSKDQITSTQNAALLKRVVKYRKDKCEACGATERLHCHHIDNNRENDTQENIQTLCITCHVNHHHQSRMAGKDIAGRLETRD